MKATKIPAQEYIINLELTPSEARALRGLFGEISKNNILEYLKSAKVYDSKIEIDKADDLQRIFYILNEIL